MPVSGDELITLVIALATTAVAVYGIRRASNNSSTKAKRGDQSDPATKTRPDSDDERRNSNLVHEQDAAIDDESADDVKEERFLSEGLTKTRTLGFISQISNLFVGKRIDNSLVSELEDVLFAADIGPKTADRLLTAVKNGLSKSELSDAQSVWNVLRSESIRILDVEAPDLTWAPPPPLRVDSSSPKTPFVLLVLGVNGAGKTTTIGKLAAKLTAEGKKVLLAAGDTFRAAAVDQLEVWGQRSQCDVVKGKQGQDPSSVIYDAIRQGCDKEYDIVIADTAGRLHTKTELMEELKKVGRVCEKALSGCPHETWLVLDSTTGQNAIQQATHFKAAMNVTGIVLTKLDGTAKGGVVLGISEEMKVPIRFLGVGEQIEDLRSFSAQGFVSALYPQDPNNLST